MICCYAKSFTRGNFYKPVDFAIKGRVNALGAGSEMTRSQQVGGGPRCLSAAPFIGAAFSIIS
jgi:hypothetical protein